MIFKIIGISDHYPPLLNKTANEWIAKAKYFSGGKRHYELVKQVLPADALWHQVKVPMTDYLNGLEKQSHEWVIFASGDPYFYGIAITLKRHFPNANIKSLPTFNSLQMLAHQCQLPYGEYNVVTLTGRPWNLFDKALIEGEAQIALLTDKKKTPQVIAYRMLEFGYHNYTLIIGENMGGEKEKVYHYSVEEATKHEFAAPNCMYLTKTNNHIPAKGIPEHELETLEGRPKMITKMPVKITTLALMQLQQKKVFWDVGACTGSMSIEAKLTAPQLSVFAFEVREESRGIIHRNERKFQIPGIQTFIGDFSQVPKEEIPKPDAVFLGGYGGEMHKILNHIDQFLEENGVLAFNAVSAKSQHQFQEWCRQNNYPIYHSINLKVNDFNEIRIYIAKKYRPDSTF